MLVKDHFDPGLEFLDPKEKKVIKSPIEYPLGDLPAGKWSKFDLTFHVTQAGNLCHTVEVLRQKEVLTTKRACVMVSAQSTPPPGIASPGGQIPSRTAPSTTQGTAPGAAQGPAPGNKPQTPPDYRQGTAPSTPSPSTAAGVPTVTIKQSGPKTSQHAVGDVVSFVSQIANPNSRPLTNLKITYHFDPALLPKLVTDHYRVEGGNLVWVIAQLPPGNYTQIEVKYECVKAAVKAGNTVSVSSSEGAQAQDTAYLEIRPAPGGAASGASTPGGAAPGGTALGGGTPGGTPWSGRAKKDENQPGEDRYGTTAPKTAQSSSALTMTVAALHNPVAAGKELTYQISVVNNTGAADREVKVTAIVPDGLIPVPLGTTGPGPTQLFDVDRQTVNFNPVMALQPGETLSYKVRVLTKSPGHFQFSVKLTSQNTTQPIIQEADTEVFLGDGQKKDER